MKKQITFSVKVVYERTLTFAEFKEEEGVETLTPEEQKTAWMSLVKSVERGDYEEEQEEEDENGDWTESIVEQAVNDCIEEVERARTKVGETA